MTRCVSSPLRITQLRRRTTDRSDHMDAPSPDRTSSSDRCRVDLVVDLAEFPALERGVRRKRFPHHTVHETGALHFGVMQTDFDELCVRREKLLVFERVESRAIPGRAPAGEDRRGRADPRDRALHGRRPEPRKLARIPRGSGHFQRVKGTRSSTDNASERWGGSTVSEANTANPPGLFSLRAAKLTSSYFDFGKFGVRLVPFLGTSRSASIARERCCPPPD